MAPNHLGHHLFKLFTMFLFSWPQPSLHSLDNKWKSHDCTSRGNHTYCKKSLKFMRPKTCGQPNLMDFEQWEFMSSSVLLKVFPVDAERRNYVRQVADAVFSVVRPVPLKYKPSLLAVSSEVLTEILDLKMSAAGSQAFVEFIAGNKILPNSVLLSHRYGGHQVCICIKIEINKASVRQLQFCIERVKEDFTPKHKFILFVTQRNCFKSFGM